MPAADYRPRPGAHLTVAQAGVVGEAIERARAEFGRSFTVEQFETLCARRSDPVHALWVEKRSEIVDQAGRSAASYLLRSVVIIMDRRRPTELREATIVLTRRDGTESEGTAHEPRHVARSADLLQEMEEDFKSRVRADAKQFADVAGAARMKRAAREVLDEF